MTFDTEKRFFVHTSAAALFLKEFMSQSGLSAVINYFIGLLLLPISHR